MLTSGIRLHNFKYLYYKEESLELHWLKCLSSDTVFAYFTLLISFFCFLIAVQFGLTNCSGQALIHVTCSLCRWLATLRPIT